MLAFNIYCRRVDEAIAQHYSLPVAPQCIRLASPVNRYVRRVLGAMSDCRLRWNANTLSYQTMVDNVDGLFIDDDEVDGAHLELSINTREQLGTDILMPFGENEERVLLDPAVHSVTDQIYLRFHQDRYLVGLKIYREMYRTYDVDDDDIWTTEYDIELYRVEGGRLRNVIALQMV